MEEWKLFSEAKPKHRQVIVFIEGLRINYGVWDDKGVFKNRPIGYIFDSIKKKMDWTRVFWRPLTKDDFKWINMEYERQMSLPDEPYTDNNFFVQVEGSAAEIIKVPKAEVEIAVANYNKSYASQL